LAGIVSLSSHLKAGNIEAHMDGQLDYWTYSFENCKWEKHDAIIHLDRLHLSLLFA
jgi:hypothetical protein